MSAKNRNANDFFILVIAFLWRTPMCWHPLARKLQRRKKMTDTPKLQQAADSGLPSHDLLCVLREIEDAKDVLKMLRKKRDEIANRPKAEKYKMILDENQKHNDQAEHAMRLAASGMAITKIAEKLGCSKHSLRGRISRIWRKRYKHHYAANREKIYDMGLLEALRDAPPLFISSHNFVIRSVGGWVISGEFGEEFLTEIGGTWRFPVI
jgi:hypothetical protein